MMEYYYIHMMEWKRTNNRMDECQKHCAKQKQPDTKSTCRIIPFTWNSRRNEAIATKIRSLVARSQDWGNKIVYWGTQWNF